MLGRALELLQFTDTHLYGDAAGTLRGIATLETLQRVLQHARAAIARADALLVTGDIVQDDPSGYRLFRELFGALGKPVWCLPGNHDLPDELRKQLAAPPFQVGGLIDRQGWRIVLLDTFLADSAGGRVPAAELQRLERALASAANLPVLVCLHHQPVPMQSRWLDSVGLANGPELLQVLDRHPGTVRALLWGHVHQAFEGERNGVRLLATPSTCVQFLPRAEHFALDERPPAYRRLQLLPNGSIASEVIWVAE